MNANTWKLASALLALLLAVQTVRAYTAGDQADRIGWRAHDLDQRLDAACREIEARPSRVRFPIGACGPLAPLAP